MAAWPPYFDYEEPEPLYLILTPERIGALRKAMRFLELLMGDDFKARDFLVLKEMVDEMEQVKDEKDETDA